MLCPNIINQLLWVLTNLWRWCGEGVAQVLFAAEDIEVGRGAGALLQVVLLEETTFLIVVFPQVVETDVSSASSVHTCAFFILACAQQLLIVFSD